jgi:hypothetical protein
MNSKYLLAICGLAIGATTAISATPAIAVTFNTGELDFGVFTSPFATAVNPIPGNTVPVTFNPSGTASIFASSGSFTSAFNPGTIGVNAPSPVSLAYVSPTSYRLANDLVINFANNVGFTLRQNSTFVLTPITNNGILTGNSFQLANNAGSFFTSGGDITNIPTLAFSLTDNGLPSGGVYIAQASPTAVPEPFTIIGTIVGGTAALRMRKKLISAVSK